RPCLHTAAEVIFVQVIGDSTVDQIEELVALGQVVNRDDVLDAAAVQPAHQVAADEAGGARDDDHVCSPASSAAVTTDVPSLPTTMPPARLAHAKASTQGRPIACMAARAASTVSPAPDTSNSSSSCASTCSRPPTE